MSSASIDQRAKGEVSLVSAKESEFAYMPTQPAQTGFPAGASSMADPYSFMSNYYPYYAMPDDMTAAGAWSTGDVASSAAAMGYGYGAADYGAMMTDYGYGVGWFPGADGTAWGTTAGVPAAVKDEQGNAYATAGGGYYTMEAVPVYGNATGAPSAQQQQDNGQRDLEIVEQGMQGININGIGRHGAGEYSKDAAGAAHSTTTNNSSGAAKSWATVAGQPGNHSYGMKAYGGPQAFPRAPLQSAKMHDGAWESRAGGEPGRPAHDGWSASRRRPNPASGGAARPCDAAGGPAGPSPTLVPQAAGQYNPKEFDLSPKSARFFIIKSYAEDDIHRSIKYGIWCSTEYGNKRLDAAYREREGKGPIYLFFSVNGSGHFCGIAQMLSAVDYQSSAGVWAQDKWKGKFEVRWIYVKDVPNSQLRHIRLENNEGKPVTNSRDTQEVPPEKGCQVLRVIHQYRHTTSIFDDFSHYEKRQEEEDYVKK